MKDFFAAIGLFAFILGIADYSPAARSKDIHDIDSSIVNVYLDHVMGAPSNAVSTNATIPTTIPIP